MPGGGNGGWIKVERVRGRLFGVQSGGGGAAQGAHEGQWVCYVCEQTKNYATRKTCRKCGCSKDSVVQAQATARKGKIGLGKEAGKSANPPTRRVQQAADQQQAKELKELRAQVASLTAKLTAGKDAMVCDQEAEEDELDLKIKELRGSVNFFAQGPPAVQIYHQMEKSKLDALLAERRQAKSLDVRASETKIFLDRKKKALDKQKGVIAEFQRQIDELQAKMDKAAEQYAQMQLQVQEAEQEHAQQLREQAAKVQQSGVPPQVQPDTPACTPALFQQCLQFVAGGFQEEHLTSVGATKEQLMRIFDMAGLLAASSGGGLPTPGAGPQAGWPGAGSAGPGVGAAKRPAAAEEEPEEAEEMDEEKLFRASEHDGSDLADFKAKMRERASRKRKATTVIKK